MTRWKDVRGWEGLYAVSRAGEVKSFDRACPCRSGGRAVRRGRVLKAIPKANGYLCVTLADGPLRRQRFVHDLVLAAFVGPKPKGKQAAHNNGVRSDNRRKNLRYDTPLGNTSDKHAHGTVAKGAAHGMAKLTARQARAIKRARARGAELARRFGVSVSQVSAIRTGRAWKCLDSGLSRC